MTTPPTRPEDRMSTVMWILIGVGVWILVALALALLLGRTVRLRDRQVPDPPEDRSSPGQERPVTPPPRCPPEPRSPRPPPGG
ncbi:hypothetical protein ACLFMI_23985 [Pseudonocardia nantongensis]|uniref:hypothetical protein n=1 Tax=Pseudonocardia nantongensis TaxID=1181885 RepID=UPI00397DBF20